MERLKGCALRSLWIWGPSDVSLTGSCARVNEILCKVLREVYNSASQVSGTGNQMMILQFRYKKHGHSAPCIIAQVNIRL